MIVIKNMRNTRYVDTGDEYKVRIDRKSIFGNPFFMKDESQRDFVCEQYENKADYSNGCFNTVTPKINSFNKPSEWTYHDWQESTASLILSEMPVNYNE